jgi:hypothetical protein
MGPRKRARANVADIGTTVRHYVRGYWIAHLLAEIDLEFLMDLLSERRSRRQLESRIAARLGFSPEAFWTEADPVALSHFGKPTALGPA